jgi:hypothetical protein
MRYNRERRQMARFGLVTILLATGWLELAPAAESPEYPAILIVDPQRETDLQVEVTKKGLGKEVSIRKGTKEWYMLIEVTIDNTVVVRQEKDNDTYLLDESETHDRAMTKAEVDAAIEDFINSVKTKAKRK